MFGQAISKTRTKCYVPNLSVVSKLLERLVSSQLVKYLKYTMTCFQIFSRRKQLFSRYWLALDSGDLAMPRSTTTRY